MLRKYEEETEKLGYPEICGPWKNSFKFERIKPLSTEIENPYKNLEPGKLVSGKSGIKNVESQNFSFRITLIQYILKNARPSTLRKLHHSCKLFYTSTQIPICHRLYLGKCYFGSGVIPGGTEFIEFDRQSMYFSTLPDDPVEKFMISNTL